MNKLKFINKSCSSNPEENKKQRNKQLQNKQKTEKMAELSNNHSCVKCQWSTYLNYISACWGIKVHGVTMCCGQEISLSVVIQVD
jgi:hypothetical protein